MALAVLACSGDEPAGPAPPVTALRYRALSAGYYHTCGVTLESIAYCWGRNDFGTLGDGTRDERDLPSPVAGAHAFVTIDAGAGHNCALTAAGEAWCWGHNDEGQLGDGTFQGRDAPVPVPGGLTFTAISAGHAHSCGLRAGGEAWCWGDDSRGQLGDGGPGSTSKSALPVRVQASQPFSQLVAGYYGTCALATDGSAWCWGGNDSGQVGDGTTTNRHQPTAVLGGHTFTAISVGDRFACGISDGRAWCWGANRQGELGSAGGTGSPQPVEVEGSASWSTVAAAAGASTIPGAEPYACAITGSGAVRCWGGAVRALRAADAGPAGLEPVLTAQDVAPGAQHLCVLDRQGHAWCGGANYAGQLGDGSHSDRATLVGVRGPE